MNTNINNSKQVLNDAEKEFKASMFDVIAFYQGIMKDLEVVIFDGNDLVNSQTERDTWAEYHELLSNVILDTNNLMNSLLPLHEKAKECMNIIQKRTKSDVKVEEDKDLHEVSSVVSKSDEGEKDDHKIQDLEKQVEELKASLAKATSSLEETINNRIGEVKKDVEDHDKEIRGIIEEKIISETSEAPEEVVEDSTSTEEKAMEVQDESQKVIIPDDRVTTEEVADDSTSTEEKAMEVQDESQKVIIDSETSEAPEEVVEVSPPTEEKAMEVQDESQKVIIPDDRVTTEEVAEVSPPTEETAMEVQDRPTKVIIIPDDRVTTEEVAEVSPPMEETTMRANEPTKVIIIPDDRVTPVEVNNENLSVNPSVDLSQNEVSQGEVAETTSLANDIVIQENPEVSEPVASAIPENSGLVVEQPVQNDIAEQPVQNDIAEQPVQNVVVEQPVQNVIAEQPVQNVVAEQQTAEVSSMMPSFSEIPVVNDGVVMEPNSEITTVPEVPAIVSSQQVERPPKVFATSAGYKGNALSVNLTQAANLRKSKKEQLAKIIPIIPYLGIGESDSVEAPQTVVADTTPTAEMPPMSGNNLVEAPQAVVADTTPMVEMPPMSENDYANISEEQLAEMVNQVSVLYNEKRYEEAEALSQKISELSKRYSAQDGKILSKEYSTQMVA